MSLLVIMGIKWEVDGHVSGFEYSFVNYEIKGYYIKDHVQVTAVINLAIDTVQGHHPTSKKLSFSQIMQVYFPHKN